MLDERVLYGRQTGAWASAEGLLDFVARMRSDALTREPLETSCVGMGTRPGFQSMRRTIIFRRIRFFAPFVIALLGILYCCAKMQGY